MREDLFLQTALELASLSPIEDRNKIADRVAASREVVQRPTSLDEGGAFSDPAAYAAALAQARKELKQVKSENERLQRVAEASQGSGWVRFGAWLGDRSARRIMEMDAENSSIQPPDGKVERGGKDNPDEVGNKEP